MKRVLVLGVVLAFVLALTLPCFAVDTYDYNGYSLPLFSEYDELRSEYPYLMLIEAEDGFYFYLSSSLVQASLAGDMYGLVSPYITDMLVYSLADDDCSWVYLNTKYCSSGSWFVSSSNGSYLRWCNFDIYSSDGILHYEGDLNFLRPPLEEVVQAVTAEGLTEMLPKVAGTMKILALCGVGCLASLAVLRLFGKRSLIYRS